MTRAWAIKIRFNETHFSWKPFVGTRHTPYVGWLWFCVNFDWYRKLREEGGASKGGTRDQRPC